MRPGHAVLLCREWGAAARSAQPLVSCVQFVLWCVVPWWHRCVGCCGVVLRCGATLWLWAVGCVRLWECDSVSVLGGARGERRGRGASESGIGYRGAGYVVYGIAVGHPDTRAVSYFFLILAFISTPYSVPRTRPQRRRSTQSRAHTARCTVHMRLAHASRTGHAQGTRVSRVARCC